MALYDSSGRLRLPIYSQLSEGTRPEIRTFLTWENSFLNMLYFSCLQISSSWQLLNKMNQTVCLSPCVSPCTREIVKPLCISKRSPLIGRWINQSHLSTKRKRERGRGFREKRYRVNVWSNLSANISQPWLVWNSSNIQFLSNHYWNLFKHILQNHTSTLDLLSPWQRIERVFQTTAQSSSLPLSAALFRSEAFSAASF